MLFFVLLRSLKIKIFFRSMTRRISYFNIILLPIYRKYMYILNLDKNISTICSTFIFLHFDKILRYIFCIPKIICSSIFDFIAFKFAHVSISFIFISIIVIKNFTNFCYRDWSMKRKILEDDWKREDTFPKDTFHEEKRLL